jgi:hypothetical protein
MNNWIFQVNPDRYGIWPPSQSAPPIAWPSSFLAMMFGWPAIPNSFGRVSPVDDFLNPDRIVVGSDS